MEGDKNDGWEELSTALFQSTPSAWRETITAANIAMDEAISIHSLRMEGDPRTRYGQSPDSHFNPLPPHGGRHGTRNSPMMQYYFNPLPPHGGRRKYDFGENADITISIHSLRMEGDQSGVRTARAASHFNPLPPHGGRQFNIFDCCTCFQFQSTPSAWRETFPRTLTSQLAFHFNPLPPHGGRQRRSGIRDDLRAISIHSLRMEGDEKEED